MATAPSTKFASVIRDRLVENRVSGAKPDSIRGLARAMANGEPVRAETFKRSLFKWMAPGEPNPSRASRALVAAALGLAAGELEDDDEEADLAVAFDTMLRLRIRQILRDEVGA